MEDNFGEFFGTNWSPISIEEKAGTNGS